MQTHPSPVLKVPLTLAQRKAHLEQEQTKGQQLMEGLARQRQALDVQCGQTSAELLQIQGALKLVAELEADLQAAAEQAKQAAAEQAAAAVQGTAEQAETPDQKDKR